MATGLSMAAVFGVFWFTSGHLIWAILMVFLGIIPGIQGLARVLGERAERKRISREMPRIAAAEREKEILRLARQHGGRVTPAIAALQTSCSIEEAEQILQDLAGKGYATAEVLDSGRLEYQFPEFME